MKTYFPLFYEFKSLKLLDFRHYLPLVATPERSKFELVLEYLITSQYRRLASLAARNDVRPG